LQKLYQLDIMQYYLVNMDKGTYFDAQNENEKVPRLAQYD